MILPIARMGVALGLVLTIAVGDLLAAQLCTASPRAARSGSRFCLEMPPLGDGIAVDRLADLLGTRGAHRTAILVV